MRTGDDGDGGRWAVYFAPRRTDELWRRGCAWLGRDPEEEDAPAPPEKAPRDLPSLVRTAARYGFHATLKAPFHLAAGRQPEELCAAVSELARDISPFTAPPLTPRRLGRFRALVTETPSGPLADLAAIMVTRLDGFRAPMTSSERDRRLAAGLTRGQIELLDRFGYPYVGPEFHFHLTLTDPIPDDRDAEVDSAIADWFAPALGAPLDVTEVCLFHQGREDGTFRLLRRFPLGTTPPNRAMEPLPP